MGYSDIEYDATIDWGLQVLEFAKTNPSFCGSDDYHNDIKITYKEVNYLEVCGKKTREEINYIWYKWHLGQLRLKDKVKRDMEKIRAMSKSDNQEYVFITVGFHISVPVPFMTKVADQIIKMNGGFISRAEYCFELHRTDKNKPGELILHPHVHMLVTADKRLRVSKWAEIIFKLKDIKQYVHDKNFIDIKVPNHQDWKKKAQPYPQCLQYIQGIKTTEKMVCVSRDIEWRRKNGLQDQYSYVRP